MKSIKFVPYILLLMLGLSACLGNDELEDLSKKKYARIKEQSIIITPGERIKMGCHFDSEETAAKKFKWSILDNNIGNIESLEDNSSIITGLSEGQTTIQVESEDGKLKYFSTLSVLKDRSVKILAIGDSFTEDAIDNNLFELVQATGKKIVIANLYREDSSLEANWKDISEGNASYTLRKTDINGGKNNVSDITIAEAVKNENWDYICFQENNRLAGIIDGYQEYLPLLVDTIKSLASNPDVKYALHQTWAYAKNSDNPGFDKYGNDQSQMYKAIIDAVSKGKDYAGIDIIIPTGTSIQNARTSYIGEKITRDGTNLNLETGRFTAACIWYDTLFGNVMENSYIPSYLSLYNCRLAKTAAHFATITPDKVTVLDEFEFAEPNDFELEFPVYIDFGPVASENPYNCYLRPTDGKLMDLLDEKGTNTGFSIQVDKPFTDVIEWQIPNSFNLPWTVSNDMFFGDGIYIPESSLIISNLNRNQKYTIVIYGSIGVDDTETDYILNDLNGERLERINTAHNFSTLATFEGVVATDDSSVTLTVKPGPNNTFWSKFYNINVMYIMPEGYNLFP